MYIIVVGGGKIGFALSQSLLLNGHEVLCIEQDAQRNSINSKSLGSASFIGDGCEVSVLDKIGANRADALIATTGDDQDNLITCQIAKHKFGVPKTIAQINNPQNRDIFRILGVDATVNITEVIMSQIVQEMPEHPLVPVLSLQGTGQELCHVDITTNSSVIGKQLNQIELPGLSRIALIIDKNREVKIPSDTMILRSGDEIIAVTRPEDEEKLRILLTGDN